MHALVWLSLLLPAAEPAPAALPIETKNAPTWRLSFDEPLRNDDALGLLYLSVESRPFAAGAVAESEKSKLPRRANRAAAEFDGTDSLLRLAPTPATAAAFTPDAFTWEGFFFHPSTNAVELDKAISDRFLTQFRDDKSGSTRIAVGLSRAKKPGPINLAVCLAGESTRKLGNREVTPDVWHHFAVVVTPPETTGPADKLEVTKAGLITFYLDYEKCGEVKLDGKTPATTLSPLGPSPLGIGGRNLANGKVDRGFGGLLDELRITPRALKVEEFQRTTQTSPDRLVRAEFLYPLSEPFDWQELRTRKPTETLDQETLGLVGVPEPFSPGGYADPRRGTWAVRTTQELKLSAGRYRVLVRTAADAVLELDGKPLLDARLPSDNPLGPSTPGARDYAAEFTASGKPQTLSLLGVVRFGEAAKRTNYADSAPAADSENPAGVTMVTDEVIVGLAKLDAKTGAVGDWQLLGPAEATGLDPFAWRAARGRTQAHWGTLAKTRQAAALARGEEFWKARHAWAAQQVAKWKYAASVGTESDVIDALLATKMKELKVEPAPIIDDASFLRRVTLDLAGRNPTVAEAEAYFADASADKREKLVDRLLAAPEWADSWVGYWQDLLAENPSILKPTLNNSGPFRRWIHESFAANKPMDRFAAELILMQGDDGQGGTEGFAMSSGNDLPMAMKGHVLAQAFMGIDMKCARCHDAPYAPLEQADLFGLAAMLDEKPLVVPKASTVQVPLGARKPNVTSALKPGDKIEPQWPLEQLLPTAAADGDGSLAGLIDRPRARLAAIITSPTHSRFSDVLVNRAWQRYMGLGLIEPVDHWMETSEASHPELLAELSREFVRDGYDMKRLVRKIVTSQAYQRAVGPRQPVDASQRTFASQTRRRMSAEQVVDSLFSAVGKRMHAEELNFDPNGTQGFLTLPAPEKAWQFASLSNERDRPALALPVNQMILDVLQTFGWRETRPDPWTRTDAEPNPLQPLMMANSQIINQIVRLTEESVVTEWCLEDITAEALTTRLFLATVSRRPNPSELKLVSQVLSEGFAKRKTGAPKPPPVKRIVAHVDWDKHLKGEASVELMAAEKQAREGDPVTVRLTPDFRRAVEDVLWSLVNSPEFVFVP